MADKRNDPVAMWHNMLGEMEKGFNAFANQALTSPEFSKVVNQVGGVSAGAQKQVSELMEKYLTSLNLPSRAQLTNFGDQMEAIEGQLVEITALLRQIHHSQLHHNAGGPENTARPENNTAKPVSTGKPEAAPVIARPSRTKRPPPGGQQK
jgi:hypothetical protein